MRAAGDLTWSYWKQVRKFCFQTTSVKWVFKSRFNHACGAVSEFSLCSRYSGGSGTRDGRLLIDAPWLHASHTDRQLRNLSNRLGCRLTQTCAETPGRVASPVRAAPSLAAPLTSIRTAHDPDVCMTAVCLSHCPQPPHTHTDTHTHTHTHTHKTTSHTHRNTSWCYS